MGVGVGVYIIFYLFFCHCVHEFVEFWCCLSMSANDFSLPPPVHYTLIMWRSSGVKRVMRFYSTSHLLHDE